jgi:TolB protein
VVPLGTGQQAGRSQVPWSQVGPGWTLALWTPSTTVDKRTDGAVLRNVPESLFLLNPVGGRYLIKTLPVDSHLQLEEWSGDGRRALFMHWADGQPATYSELDLATGAWHDIDISGALTVGYTKPLGLALLVQRNSTLERVDRNGVRQLLYPTSEPDVGKVSGGYYTPDGSRLVRYTDHGWVLTTNDGTVVGTLGLPDGTARCFFHRWWSTTTMLVTCYPAATSDDPRLWLVPITGAAATPLPTSQSQTYDAVQVGSKTFLEHGYIQCDGTDLSVLQPDGGARALNFQQRTGTHHGVHILQATRQLLYLGVGLGCGTEQQIASYDPHTDELRTLLGGRVNGGSIVFALGYRATDPPS